MKLHTCLTSQEVGMTLERAQRQGRITQDMQFAVFTPSSSLTHQHGYEIQLGTYDQNSLPARYADQNGRTLRVRRARNASHGSARWAATWHEWGWLIAEIFAADPESRWGANPARSRHPWGYFSPEDFHAKTSGQFRTRRSEHLQEITMTTLHAFREDGTEVLPGETVTMTGLPHTFRAATRVSNDAGTDGMIAVDGYPAMFSAPYGLTVRAVSAAKPEPKPKPKPEAWVPVWDRELNPGTAADQPEAAPATLDAALAVVNHTRIELTRVHASGADTGECGERDDYAEALESLADTVREYLTPDPERTAAMAAEADRDARTTAPPVPGVTQNTGHTVYAVLGHRPAVPGLLESWVVAAADEAGEHVTWTAYASDDGSGRLHYDGGHYHGSGDGADSEALADLANRAGVFSALTGLASGTATREAFQDSHQQVLTDLSGVHGVGRARIRAGLLEAAALGYARISWHERGMRKDYGIRYDRYRCTFTWNREN